MTISLTFDTKDFKYRPDPRTQLDDDFLYEQQNEKPMKKNGYWSYDPDFSCNPDE